MMNFGKKFAVGVASAALVASLGGVVAPVAVAGNYSAPNFIGGLERLSGADRVATSLQVAAHEWGHRDADIMKRDGRVVEDLIRTQKAKRVYVASADDAHMVDAATAGMLLDGPVVYVTSNVYVGTAVGRFLADTKTYPGFKSIEEVVPIGGEAAVPASVAKAVADQIKVGSNKTAKVGSALAGKDRYATSVAIAQYMYDASQDRSNKWYGGGEIKAEIDKVKYVEYGRNISNQHDGSLHVAYFANGADNHIVDSMVAGTLDNGPILLTEPDGKIPEAVAEFIKKTLPTAFGALGGTAAVPDSTVNEAWVIKALANKWDSSYNVPGANMSVRELERLVYGTKGGSEDVTADDFYGLEKAIEKSEGVQGAWDREVEQIKLDIRGEFIKGTDGKLTDQQVTSNVLEKLKKLYGDKVITQTDAAGLNSSGFLEGEAGAYTGVAYSKIEASEHYAKVIKNPKDELVQLWKGQKQDPDMTIKKILKTDIAILSQEKPSDADILSTSAGTATSGHSLMAVRDLAEFTVKTQKEWLALAKKQLAQAKGVLRGELDKIDAKTVLRLGGKDRFETAQLIANQWAKNYGHEIRQTKRWDDKNNKWVTVLDDKFFETYVANGHRLPDSLTAGQLTRGPIMLVRGGEKSVKELSPFTANVATRLQCWTDKKHTLNLFGIGGKAVLADSALQAVVDLANTGSVCAPEKPTKTVTKSELSSVLISPADAATRELLGTDAAKHLTYGAAATGLNFDVKLKDGTNVEKNGTTVHITKKDGTTNADSSFAASSLALTADGKLTITTKKGNAAVDTTPAGEYVVYVKTKDGNTYKAGTFEINKFKITSVGLTTGATSGYKAAEAINLAKNATNAVATSALLLQPKDDGTATSLPVALSGTATYTVPGTQKFTNAGAADASGNITAALNSTNKLQLTPTANITTGISPAVKAEVKVKVTLTAGDQTNYKLAENGEYMVPVWFEAK